MTLPAKKILLVANTAWNLWNYRKALISNLIQADFEVVLAAPGDRFQNYLQENCCCRFVLLRHLSRRSFSIWQNALCLLEFVRLFRRERPALVLLFTIKPNILGNLAARIAAVPTLSIIEGLGYSGSQAARWRRLAAPLYRLALRKTEKVVFLNQDDAHEFRQHQLVRLDQALVIQGPGVDMEHFQPARHLPGEKTIFLFCGRLLVEKGIREFVQAAARIIQNVANAEFQVLGSPDPENPSSVSARELQIWKKESPVTFLGSADDVRLYLAKADVLVLPSYYREGVPRSVLEAMAMGKIIVTTDTPGCRDTVEAGKNGFLIPPKNVEALVAVLHEVLKLSPETRRQMGAFSRQKAAREFSDDQVLPHYLQLIESLTS